MVVVLFIFQFLLAMGQASAQVAIEQVRNDICRSLHYCPDVYPDTRDGYEYRHYCENDHDNGRHRWCAYVSAVSA
jgi:hypothetical protein